MWVTIVAKCRVAVGGAASKGPPVDVVELRLLAWVFLLAPG